MAAYEGLIYLVTMGAGASAAVICYPLVSRVSMWWTARLSRYQQVKVERATRALDELFLDVKPRWLKIAYGVGPVLLGLTVYGVSQSLWMAVLGAALGAVLPDQWVRQSRLLRHHRFRGQLVEALFILSSSLRAGLSLTQAFEQLESEMPPPASQEFGLMMKAHKLGLPLEEALARLKIRMPSEELELVATAVLVARETGGDITNIIAQLITTIRERKKLLDKVSTLTLQGRLQAYVMSALPILFVMFVRSFNPDHFETLFQDPQGNLFVLLAAGLWLAGMILLIRFSRVEV